MGRPGGGKPPNTNNKKTVNTNKRIRDSSQSPKTSKKVCESDLNKNSTSEMLKFSYNKSNNNIYSLIGIRFS